MSDQPPETLASLSRRWDIPLVTPIQTTAAQQLILPADPERWFALFVATLGGAFVSPFAIQPSPFSGMGFPINTAPPFTVFDYPTFGGLVQLAWYAWAPGPSQAVFAFAGSWRIR